MIAEGKGKLSLFHIMSDIDRDIQASYKPNDIIVGDLPEWWGKFEKIKRNELSLQAENIPPVPNTEDFFAFNFRHLSATIVGAETFKATDFSKESVIRKAAPLLSERPAYLNHFLAAGQEIGFVGEAIFRKKYKNSLGDEIPAGIEAPFIIDSVLHGDLVRKMNSPVSPIDSASVTVLFNWEASHEFEDERDFFWHLGEMIDDEMVRRVVNEIVQFEESSLVWAGADPYAKMLDDNNQVVNIDRAGAFSKRKFSNNDEILDRDWAKKYYVFDCLDADKLLHLNKSVEQFDKPKETHTMKKEFIIALAKLLGTTPEALNKDEFNTKNLEDFAVVKDVDYQLLKTNSGNYETIKAEKETAEKSVADGKVKIEAYDKALPVLVKATDKEEFEEALAEVTGLATYKKENEAFAKNGKANFDKLKELSIKTYNSFAQGKPDEAIIKELDEITDPSKFETYIKMWGGQLANQFSVTCTKCESDKNIKFQSSSTPNVDLASVNNGEIEHMAIAGRK